MYEQYWQLNQKPFDNTAERAYFFPAECHQGALLKLRYSIENRRGAALLTGGAGLGKTLLVSKLAQEMPHNIRPFAHLVFPKMNTQQLLNFVASELAGQPMDSAPIEVSVRRIQDFLAQNSADGNHAVLVIDEAHLIQDADTLDTIRLLLNFQSAGEHDTSILLIGQPPVIPALNRSNGFNDRINVKCLLQPLSATETADYVNHRLTVAGAPRPLFTEEALEEIFQHSYGVPLQVNRLCDLALLIGCAEEQQVLGPEQVIGVAREIVALAEAA